MRVRAALSGVVFLALVLVATISPTTKLSARDKKCNHMSASTPKQFSNENCPVINEFYTPSQCDGKSSSDCTFMVVSAGSYMSECESSDGNTNCEVTWSTNELHCAVMWACKYALETGTCYIDVAIPFEFYFFHGIVAIQTTCAN
jgi:hypothetical protein